MSFFFSKYKFFKQDINVLINKAFTTELCARKLETTDASTKSQKKMKPSSDPLTTCASVLVKQQSILKDWGANKITISSSLEGDKIAFKILLIQ